VARAKKTTDKPAAKKKTKRTSRKKGGAEPGSRGLDPSALADTGTPADVSALVAAIEGDGGQALATYRDPLGGNWTVFAALPIEKVEPTPFQRDLSATHVGRLTEVIDKLDRFLDPIVAIRTPEGKYWTPNGNHRLHAMKNLGSKSIVALVVPQTEVAYKILALNTEKAHNVKEKALEVIRMARSLVEIADRPESDYAMEFEEPLLVTLGACYEQRARFSGGAYSPVLKRVEDFLDAPLSEALAVREARAAKLLELDDAVAEAVSTLKERGFDSPYLKAFVVARANPLRFSKSRDKADWDETIDKMLASAQKFDASKVDAGQVAKAGGASE
jgi:ParB family transcriptional regulator, chromosome partitioning protein